jgi:hypothetical protein
MKTDADVEVWSKGFVAFTKLFAFVKVLVSQPAYWDLILVFGVIILLTGFYSMTWTSTDTLRWILSSFYFPCKFSVSSACFVRYFNGAWCARCAGDYKKRQGQFWGVVLYDLNIKHAGVRASRKGSTEWVLRCWCGRTAKTFFITVNFSPSPVEKKNSMEILLLRTLI